MHLRAQIACYELKGDSSPVVLKKIFPRHLKISKFTIQDLYGKPFKRDWVARVVLLIFRRSLQSLLFKIYE